MSQKRTRRGRAEANEHAGPNDAQFRFQPGTAGGDIARAWFLVDAPFPTQLPFEVLGRVRDVDRVAIDPRFFESVIQDLGRRRVYANVFSISPPGLRGYLCRSG